MSTFFQYVVEGLTIGSFYALVALGYTMVYGIIRLINFAHGDLFMVGAFIGWSASPAPLASRSRGWPTSRCCAHLDCRF
jgi:branched-chain amino acid transport system permease protein